MTFVDERLAGDRLLCTEEAAELLGITAGALRRYAARGDVPSVKLGRAANAHRLYDRAAILALRRRAALGVMDGNGNGG